MQNKILITGSSKGIGKEVASIFLKKNWDVCITSRNKDDLNKVKQELKSNTASLIDFKTDFTNTNEIQELKKYIIKTWGFVDILVINVGSGSGEKHLISKFENNLNYFKENFYSAYYSANLLKDLLYESKKPSIIFVGSIASFKNVNAPFNYAMAKKSVENLTKALSVSLSTFGVTVNCVHFGHVLTDNSVWAKRLKDNPDEFNNFVKSHTLTNKMISQVDAARFIYNLSDEIFNRNLTGSTFVYDSGSVLI